MVAPLSFCYSIFHWGSYCYQLAVSPTLTHGIMVLLHYCHLKETTELGQKHDRYHNSALCASIGTYCAIFSVRRYMYMSGEFDGCCTTSTLTSSLSSPVKEESSIVPWVQFTPLFEPHLSIKCRIHIFIDLDQRSF